MLERSYWKLQGIHCSGGAVVVLKILSLGSGMRLEEPMAAFWLPCMMGAWGQSHGFTLHFSRFKIQDSIDSKFKNDSQTIPNVLTNNPKGDLQEIVTLLYTNPLQSKRRPTEELSFRSLNSGKMTCYFSIENNPVTGSWFSLWRGEWVNKLEGQPRKKNRELA